MILSLGQQDREYERQFIKYKGQKNEDNKQRAHFRYAELQQKQHSDNRKVVGKHN